MIEAKIVTRGNCMLCRKPLSEDEGIFFCKECGYKIIDDNSKCKKNQKINLTLVQNIIDQESEVKDDRE